MNPYENRVNLFFSVTHILCADGDPLGLFADDLFADGRAVGSAAAGAAMALPLLDQSMGLFICMLSYNLSGKSKNISVKEF